MADSPFPFVNEKSDAFETLFDDGAPADTLTGEESVMDIGEDPPAEPVLEDPPAEPAGEEPPATEPVVESNGRDASALQSELDKLKEETKDHQNLKQLLDIVTSNPALNEAVRLAVAGLDPTQAFSKAKEVVVEAAKGWQSSIPDPVKPADFDQFQSVSDPDSASYRYRAAVEEKRIQDTIDKRVFDFESKQAQTAAQQNQQTLRQQAKAQALALLDRAIVADGLADRAEEIRSWVMTGLGQSTEQQIVKMFRAVHGLDAPPAPPVVPGLDKKKTELAAQRANAEAVVASAVVPGAAVTSEPDDFFAGEGNALKRLYSQSER